MKSNNHTNSIVFSKQLQRVPSHLRATVFLKNKDGYSYFILIIYEADVDLL